jgi:tRNA threonylcarbamoyladenosine biosynthesis protein TsaE
MTETIGQPATVLARTAAEMQELGERLGRLLAVGDVVGLIGPLGAGKTTFVQGLARGLEVPADRHVASPTFALVNEHPGRVPLVHADLYRIESERELGELGLAEAADRAAVAVEWLDRFPDAVPAARLEIDVAFNLAAGAAPEERILTFRPVGERATAVIGRLMGC